MSGGTLKSILRFSFNNAVTKVFVAFATILLVYALLYSADAVLSGDLYFGLALQDLGLAGLSLLVAWAAQFYPRLQKLSIARVLIYVALFFAGIFAVAEGLALVLPATAGAQYLFLLYSALMFLFAGIATILQRLRRKPKRS